MSNSFSSNNVEDLAKGFMAEFEANKVVCNTVDTSMYQGKFTPDTGGTVSRKRPHQAQSSRTSDGDITSETKSDIISGKVSAEVQNYITVFADWTVSDEQLKFDEIRKILKPYAEQCVIDLETSLVQFIIENGGFTYGDLGTDVDSWGDIGGANARLDAVGCPSLGQRYYIMNPYTQKNLAESQLGLNAADGLVKTAWQNSTISTPFANMSAVKSNMLKTWTSSDATDRDGTLSATPTVTYAGAKDTMYQTISVTGLTTSATVKAGDVIKFTGTGTSARSMANPRTGTTFHENGAVVPWRCVVKEDVDLSGGAGDLIVSPAAIYDGTQTGYNNISASPVSGDAFSIEGSASTEYQPNIVYLKDAVSLATIPIPRIKGEETSYATTKDGLSIRVTMYGDATTNENKVRFDLWPAFAMNNPFWAGKAFGDA